MIRTLNVLRGDWVKRLRELPDKSIQCCVTSPPYWGLRDYGVKGQLGLEATPQEYIQKLVAGFREVWRVLRDDGTLWLNLGDMYATGGGKCGNHPGGGKQGERFKQMLGIGDSWKGYRAVTQGWTQPNRMPLPGLKAKDLVGMPWEVAFALRASGWYLRCDIVWHKPNPMPESVTDRPTRSHEFLFLLTKSRRYYYNAEAVAEPCASGPSDLRKMAEGKDRIDAKHFHSNPGPLAKAGPGTNIGRKRGVGGLRFAIGSPGVNSRMYKNRDPVHLRRSGNKERSYEGRLNHRAANIPWEGFRRNRRSVWTIATVPYRGAHFATFPPALIKPCILAGSKPGQKVLDPFGGSGTTAQVAIELGRSAVIIELNPGYIRLIKDRSRKSSSKNK